MEEFNTCTECFRPDVCISRCECSIIVHGSEEVAKHRDEEMFMEWINDHASNRNRGAA